MNKTIAFCLSLVLLLSILCSGCGLISESTPAARETMAAVSPAPTEEIIREVSPSPALESSREPSSPAEEESLNIPAYSGEPYAVLKGNEPCFTEDMLQREAYETYGELDALGRCTVCISCIGQELMPTEKRGEIGQIKPTGWVTSKYDFVDGKYLYNRCHLIGFQLTAENANPQNLITGTRYMNVEGMLPFENMVADYIKETGNHVLYRVTPVFAGENLVADGVEMEAFSIEDNGEGICFHVFCYNVQPGVVIDYATGENRPAEEETAAPAAETETVWVTESGSKYHTDSTCSHMKNPKEVTRQEAIDAGYEPCKKCA